MLRVLAVLLLSAAPALAWEAGSGRVCELTHQGEAARVSVTYDPAIGEYAIAITPERPWSPGPIFTIRFDGPRGLTISTDRHAVSGGGATVTVMDRGFGNVLNGLEFNDTATALLGDQAVAFALDGAGPAVRTFRACTTRVSA
ncbi:MAG: excinuclease ABC subunit B [Alphaproteobacteria bacterium]